MIRLSRLVLAAALALPALLAAVPADAASIIMCRPAAAATAPGPGRFVAPGSNTAYSLDNYGCSRIDALDVGDAQAAGFTQVGGLRAAVLRAITATPATITLPPGAYILGMVAQETSGTTITGGWRVGTTTTASDVVGTTALSALSISVPSDVSLAKRAFSSTQSQQLFWSTVGINTLINSTVQWTIIYSFF